MKQAALAVLAAVAVVNAQQAPYGQCGGIGWTGPTSCTSGWACVYGNDWYSQCVQSSGATTAATTKTTTKSTTTATKTSTTSSKTSTTKTATTTTKVTTTAGSGGGPTGLTTTTPASSGSTTLPSAKVISGTFDGGMVKYDRNPKVCEEQTETGEDDAMFILEAGATIKNVLIGPNQAEGIHCRGTCTIQNVW